MWLAIVLLVDECGEDFIHQKGSDMVVWIKVVVTVLAALLSNCQK